MKLYYSQTSPFVRKVLVAAHELGLADRIEKLPASAHPVDRDRALVARNPLGQVPTLVTDDGDVLYDSRVICEYLSELADGEVVPSDGEARWRALVDQSLADGILDAAVITRYEMAARPEALRWSDWIAGQLDKVACGLAELERRAPDFGDRIDVGTIAYGCALGYLDFRFPQIDWRSAHPNLQRLHDKLATRPSFIDTAPPRP